MLLNLDFLFLILFFISSFSFFFIHTFFLSFFSLIFSPPHMYTYPYLYLHSFFDFLFFQFLSSRLQTISPLLPLSFFLFLLHTHAHTNFSPSISHKQILSHTHIDHRHRSGDRRSTCFFFFFLVLVRLVLFYCSDFIRLMRKIVFVFQIFRLGFVFLF